MASAASPPPAKPFYGPINPAILGGFDEWEADDELITPPTHGTAKQTQEAQQVQQPPQSQTIPGTQPPSLASLRYMPFNSALLDDFDDDTASLATGLATNGGSVYEDDAPPAGVPVDAPLGPTVLDRLADVGSGGVPANAVPGSAATGMPAAAVSRIGQQARDVPSHGTEGTAPRVDTSANSLSNNPYAAAIEDKQNAMTVAFLRSPDGAASLDAPSSLAPDDLGFGQRYQASPSTTSIIITNQRRLPSILSGDRECIVCTDTKPVSSFPSAAITKTCTHEPTTCLVCVAACIRSDLANRLWNEIRCPECRATLEYDDVQRFADDETKERYQTLSFRTAISTSDAFLWCTSGCGYGQVHEGGARQPIMTCRLCAHRSCFHHKVAWHENLTCDEYDALLADPVNFRSRFDIENEEAEKAAAARQAQEDADRVFAQGLLAEEQRTVAAERAERERKQREERERKQREERERKEREKRERIMQEQREMARRRAEEEKASETTVGKTTKPCPGCGARIEKNNGCAHMTCIKCRYQFCWGCNAEWTSRHNIRCTGR
ncbi:hypothetical protein VTI74DRAFT_5846 [Chaetomium olivicolor]